MISKTLLLKLSFFQVVLQVLPACSTSHSADSSTKAIQDIQSLSKNPDGTYNASCIDFSGQAYTEQNITAEEVANQQVCKKHRIGPHPQKKFTLALPCTFSTWYRDLPTRRTTWPASSLSIAFASSDLGQGSLTVHSITNPGLDPRFASFIGEKTGELPITVFYKNSEGKFIEKYNGDSLTYEITFSNKSAIAPTISFQRVQITPRAGHSNNADPDLISTLRCEGAIDWNSALYE